jgi:hypothetical protein
MAIRNVNGRNVYVLEPRQPTGKTTSGKSWATLYSDLRWQVWEQIQKNEAQMMKIELASSKQRREYYDDKIKVLQDQRKQLQAAALKAERGSTSSANSDALRAAQGLERTARQTAGKTTETRKPAVDAFGDPVIDPATGKQRIDTVVKEETPAGGVSPKAKQVYERIVDDFLAGEASEADVKAAAEAAGVDPTTGKAVPARKSTSIDAEIDRIDSELESLLLSRQASATGIDGDLLRRSRESFASQVGVIGQGGGPFGLAPRPRRTMPFVQEDLAQERIDQFLQDREQFISDFEKQRLSELDGEVTKLEQLKKARQDVALLVADNPEDIRNQALLGGLDDEIERQDRNVRIATADIEKARGQADRIIRRGIESDERFTPRAPGELLRRDIRRDAAPPQPIRPAPTATVSTGEMEAVEVPPSAVEPSGGMGDLGLEPMSQAEREAAEEAVRAAGVEGPKAEGELPPVETERRPLPPYERAFEPEPRPAGLGGVPETPVPTGPPIELDEPSAIRNPDILDQSGFVPAPDLVEDARRYFRGMTVKKGDEKPKTIRFPERYHGGETEMVKEYLKERIRDAAPVGVDQSEQIEAVEKTGKPQASTRQRKDKYKFEVVAEGTRLASQPKKLNRLAKTEAEPENRPQHLVIVDKLYETNKGKGDNFKMTYDEISRAFADKPDQRKEAHTYLVAKDILESNIDEPLA